MEETDWIEKEFVLWCEKHPEAGVDMRQGILRQLRKEYRFWEWEGRDYLSSDAGEPPKGSNW